MVMVSPRLCPQATWEFEAEILVLHHPTTISPRYQAMGEGYILFLKGVAQLKCLHFSNQGQFAQNHFLKEFDRSTAH